MSGFWNTKEWLKKILGRKSRTDYLVILLIGVMILIVAVPVGTGKRESVKSSAGSANSAVSNGGSESRAYAKQLEEELAAMLCAMDGVGRCRVMITMEDGGDSAFLRREEPRVSGVLVAAQGAGEPVVISDISRAVMSLFGLEAHKITVVKMSVQEDSL